MAQLYADEHVPPAVADALRALGHDVLMARDDGRANQGVPDPDVLARATALGRAVVTNNRKDYHRLHRHTATHAGIISFTARRYSAKGMAAAGAMTWWNCRMGREGD